MGEESVGRRDWTEERDQRLIELWTAGRSASQIADRMGDGITRNAVIGRLHRLRAARESAGLPLGGLARVGKPRRTSAEILADATRQPTRRTRTTAQASGWKRTAQENPTIKIKVARQKALAEQAAMGQAVDAADERLPPSHHRLAGTIWQPLFGLEPVSLLEIGRDDCRWPLGDPLAPGFGFCGLPVAGEHTRYCADHHRAATVSRG